MATTLTEPRTRGTIQTTGETRILVHGARWEFYETFVDALPEGSPIRLAFDGKDLEILVTGPLHDDYADLLDAFSKAVAGALGIRFKPQGQTTWKRSAIQKGIESDRCYYIAPEKIAAAIAAKNAGSNNVEDYPNPDLAMEVDISAPEADRAGIYSSLRVAELWTFDASALTIRRLREDGTYQIVEQSGFLPIRADQVARWLLDEDVSEYSAWENRVREWARQTFARGTN
jgi:Uma2 family endonuclease